MNKKMSSTQIYHLSFLQFEESVEQERIINLRDCNIDIELVILVFQILRLFLP